MDAVATVFVGAALLGWLALTALCQPSWRLAAFIRSKDRLGLIPAWTFFAPDPGTTDYRLLVRQGDSTEALGEWCEIQEPDSWRLRRALWNPEKNENKALHDLVQILFQQLPIWKQAGVGIELSDPYLALLHFVQGQIERPSYFQFTVVESSGAMPPRALSPLLLSKVHCS